MIKKIKALTKLFLFEIYFFFEKIFISKKRKKKFKTDLKALYNKLKNYENFAFLKKKVLEIFLLF